MKKASGGRKQKVAVLYKPYLMTICNNAFSFPSYALTKISKGMQFYIFMRFPNLKLVPSPVLNTDVFEPDVFHLGYSRYSGRTQKQLVEYVRENYVKRPNFER